MASISEELIRKRAEHNEGQIGSLEEVSLHQQDIIKIDNIQNWCRDLKILFLQSNIISRIENLWKLKKLEYLNLAVNNIEQIEGLEGCESLQKLDLTLNFIGKLTSVDSLQSNFNLRELYLTGNPCWKFTNYRDYVIATLPQLEMLDGSNILPADRIAAKQIYSDTKIKIIAQENDYLAKRRIQKQNIMPEEAEGDESSKQDSTDFWKQLSDNTPETRLAMAEQIRKNHKDTTVDLTDRRPKRKIKLFKDDGCPLNVNEAKISFSMKEDRDKIVLTVDAYRHLDTSLLEVDVQPWFVRVLVKKKVLQLVLPDEVHPDRSKAQRSLTTRRLIITMPKFQASVPVTPYKSSEKVDQQQKAKTEQSHSEADSDTGTPE